MFFYIKFLKNYFLLQPEVLEQLSGLKEFWMDGNRLTLIPGVRSLTVLNILCFNLEVFVFSAVVYVKVAM